MNTNLMQIVRLVIMTLAVAGVVYALGFMERGIAIWFWVAILGISFVTAGYFFQLTRQRHAAEQARRRKLAHKLELKSRKRTTA